MHHLLVRHAQTDANRLNRAMYGKYGAPINDAGRRQAEKLHQELVKLGIDLNVEPVAVSELLRTAQTAEAAGGSSGLSPMLCLTKSRRLILKKPTSLLLRALSQRRRVLPRNVF